MITVYKYPLVFNDGESETSFEAPGGRLLKVALQGRVIQAWILHDTGSPKVKHRFKAVMTGEPLDEKFSPEWSYVDTVFIDWLVVHIFEGLNP